MNYQLKKKSEYRSKFEGSDRLFSACWSQYLRYLLSAIDHPLTDEDVTGWLDSIAAEKVNNPRSSFYITG